MCFHPSIGGFLLPLGERWATPPVCRTVSSLLYAVKGLLKVKVWLKSFILRFINIIFYIYRF